VINDFATFFREHPDITQVFFNGIKAESAYRKHAFPVIGIRNLGYQRLPSTSQAHASLSYEQKLEAWRKITALL
jgi:G:T/U-mismatch repair DNA glycosylase